MASQRKGNPAGEADSIQVVIESGQQLFDSRPQFNQRLGSALESGFSTHRLEHTGSSGRVCRHEERS